MAQNQCGDLGVAAIIEIAAFSRDLKLSYEWCEKSSDFKHPAGIPNTGFSLIEGTGVEKNASYEISQIRADATKGSDSVCCCL